MGKNVSKTIKEYWRVADGFVYHCQLGKTVSTGFVSPLGLEFWDSEKELNAKLNLSPDYFRTELEAYKRALSNQRLLSESRKTHIAGYEETIDRLKKQLSKQEAIVELQLKKIETLKGDIDLRKVCIEIISGQRDVLEKAVENLKRTCSGQEKIIKEYWERISAFSKGTGSEKEIERLNAALKLVQGHAKNYYQENDRLRSLCNEQQDAYLKLRAANEELKQALERIVKQFKGGTYAGNRNN